MSSPGAVERPHTYGEVRAWRDGTRWELIDGQAYAMTGPSWQHQSVVARLVVQLLAYFDSQGCRVLPAPLDVRLAKGNEADDEIETVVQPDISVVCDLGKLDDRGCRGAPKLVIEVLSPSTAGRDHIVKRELYDHHGVEQYWLVHPIDRLVTIYRRSEGAGFAAPAIFEARGVVGIEGFAALALDWDRVFADISPVD